MRHRIKFIAVLLVCFSSVFIYAQNNVIDTKHFYLDKTVRQNKSIFKFWRGKVDSTHNKLIIERIAKGKDTLLFNDYIRDGIYHMADRNLDGFKDFITYYHDYDEINFFEPKTNGFKVKSVNMPMTFGLVDSSKDIFWGYRDAQYSEKFNYSILYKYDSSTPIFYYKLVFETPEYADKNPPTNGVSLYKFENGNYEKQIFLRHINVKNPLKFDYKKFWNLNFKQLLGYKY